MDCNSLSTSAFNSKIQTHSPNMACATMPPPKNVSARRPYTVCEPECKPAGQCWVPSFCSKTERGKSMVHGSSPVNDLVGDNDISRAATVSSKESTCGTRYEPDLFAKAADSREGYNSLNTQILERRYVGFCWHLGRRDLVILAMAGNKGNGLARRQFRNRHGR